MAIYSNETTTNALPAMILAADVDSKDFCAVSIVQGSRFVGILNDKDQLVYQTNAFANDDRVKEILLHFAGNDAWVPIFNRLWGHYGNKIIVAPAWAGI